MDSRDFGIFIMKILSKLFGSKKAKQPIEEELTEADIANGELSRKQINSMTQKDEYLRCPDCQGKFLEGPSGGCCVNFKCEDCGNRFNVAFGFGQIIWAERI